MLLITSLYSADKKYISDVSVKAVSICAKYKNGEKDVNYFSKVL